MESKQQEETTGKSKQEQRHMIMYNVIDIISRWPAICAISDSGQASLHQGEESNYKGGWSKEIKFLSLNEYGL